MGWLQKGIYCQSRFSRGKGSAYKFVVCGRCFTEQLYSAGISDFCKPNTPLGWHAFTASWALCFRNHPFVPAAADSRRGPTHTLIWAFMWKGNRRRCLPVLLTPAKRQQEGALVPGSSMSGRRIFTSDAFYAQTPAATLAAAAISCAATITACFTRLQFHLPRWVPFTAVGFSSVVPTAPAVPPLDLFAWQLVPGMFRGGGPADTVCHFQIHHLQLSMIALCLCNVNSGGKF